MQHSFVSSVKAHTWQLAVLAGFLVGGFGISLSHVQAAAKARPRMQPQKASKPIAPPAPPSALLTVEDWQKASLGALQPGEIDRLLAKELLETGIKPAALCSDEQFVRRATLDLTGELPLPADIREFVADGDAAKRARLIDRLLDSDEYARHWARYWRDVVTARLPDGRALFLAGGFENWLFQELKTNRPWSEIARAMITASGELRFDQPEKNGAIFFLAAHRGAEADSERAAETSRIFLGIQIQCAQCHDHPSDQWKRVQFHQLAGYFARMRERPIRDGQRVIGFELTDAPRGEHEMPSKEDPKTGMITPPRFLDGKSPGTNLGDRERRVALASAIVNKDNYWFAAAYVNRVWGVLMGQSFYEPIDDMGPQKEAIYPTVLTRLTGSFRGTNYDVKDLLRAVTNSQAYQRQSRLDNGGDEHLHFAAVYPTRLPADALWRSLVGVLGNLGGPIVAQKPRQRPGIPQGLEALFTLEFDVDPSRKGDEVEGSLSQALLLMNNPTINQRIQAQGASLLARILKAYPTDRDALAILYLRTLAREPTAHELETCAKHLQQAASRKDGFEDILWALLNSTEFQTKR